MRTENFTAHRLKVKKGKGSFYIVQYPVRWTAQSALHLLQIPQKSILMTMFLSDNAKLNILSDNAKLNI